MKFNKIFIVSLLILAILTIGAVSASENVTSDDLSVDDVSVQESSIDDNFDDNNANENGEVIEETDSVLSVEEGDVVGVEDNNENTMISEDITNDDAILTSQNTDSEVLSATKTRKLIVNFYKQTGKYANDKKIYAKLIDPETNKTLSCYDFGNNVERFFVSVDVYDSNNKYCKGEEFFLLDSSDEIMVLDWQDSYLGDGNFKIKNPSFEFNDDSYNNLIIEGETNVKVYKNYVKITAKSISVPVKSNKKFTVKVTGSDKKPVAYADLKLKIFTGQKYKTHYLTTNSKGILNYKVSGLSPGKHKVVVSVDSGDEYFRYGLYGKSVTYYITISKIPVKIKASKLSTTYKSGKYFKAKIINSKTKKAVKGVKVIFKVYTGKKAKKITLTSNSKGIVKYSSSKLKVGKHKVVLKLKSNHVKGSSKTSSIKVSKAGLKISAKSVTRIYKKSGKFTVTVKNKASGKAVKGIKVTIKVYTGKKYKYFTAKTNGKGKAIFSTKSFSNGKHKVAVTAKANSNFKKASAKSSVVILKNKISTKIIVKNRDVELYHDQRPIYGQDYPGGLVYVVRYEDHGFYTHAYFTPILKDAYGHKLKLKYKAEMWVDGVHRTGEVITGKFGESNSYTASGIHSDFKLTIKFAGTGKYKSKEVTVKI